LSPDLSVLELAVANLFLIVIGCILILWSEAQYRELNTKEKRKSLFLSWITYRQSHEGEGSFLEVVKCYKEWEEPNQNQRHP
jgi:hypothetical protein